MGATDFASSFSHFPAGISGRDTLPYPSISWLARILPFADQNAIWDQTVLDYQNDLSPFHGGHVGLRTLVKLFHCPSDPVVAEQQWTPDGRLIALTSYVGVNGTNYRRYDGVFYTDSNTKSSDIIDGLSQTLIIGERPPSPDFRFGWWYAVHGHARGGSPNMLLGVAEINDPQPTGETTFLESCPPGPYEFGPGNPNDLCSTLHFWSHHGTGAQFAFADGSVHFVPYSISPDTMNSLATRAGNEPGIALD